MISAAQISTHPWHRFGVKRVLLAAFLVGATSSGHAFAPRKNDPAFVASRPVRDYRATYSRDVGAWHAIWDRDTGVPLRLWGSYVDAPGSVNDAAIAERAAKQFLAQHLALLAPGSTLADFDVVANQLDGKLRTVGFAQRHGGLRVIGGQLGFVFGNDRLFAISSEALPHVQVAAVARSRATSTRAESWLSAAVGHRVITRAFRERAILPLVSDSGVDYHVVDVLDVEAIDAPARWDVFVAPDGTPIARRSVVSSATGTLVYNVGARYGGGTRIDAPAPNVTIDVDGAQTSTDDAGVFSWTGTGSASVKPALANPLAFVINTAGALASANLVAMPNQSVGWNLAGDEEGDAQLSTFIYANIVKRRDQRINPSVAQVFASTDFRVNNMGQPCNAFAVNDEVLLYVGNMFCENTGRMADVVYHEFGHVFHKRSIIDGVGANEPRLAEGLADFNAANITEDPAIGRGYYRNDTPLRDIDPGGLERVWPDDDSSDTHVAGMIVAGALWDLRKRLVVELGHDAGVLATEAIFAGVLQRASDIPTSYQAALVADDDDGNLGNGTPHFCAIRDTFGVHGLVPDFATTRARPPVVDGLELAVTIDTPASAGCPLPQVTGIAVTWSAGGAPQTFALSAQGDTWRGSLPGQADGTVLTYSVLVSYSDGTEQALPNNLADREYQLYVGPVTPIYCESFDTDPAWTSTGDWEVGVPGKFTSVGDPAVAYSPERVLGTDVTSDDGRYARSQAQFIETPSIDVASFTGVRLQYRRWLAIEDSVYDRGVISANGTELWRNGSDIGGDLDHRDREWRFHDLDLTSHVVDGHVQVRWSLAADSSKQLGGWNLDDVCIVGTGKLARCGDQFLDDGETCDDGNLDDGDGCSASCSEEATAGGGCCAANSQSPATPLIFGAFVIAIIRRKRRA